MCRSLFVLLLPVLFPPFNDPLLLERSASALQVVIVSVSVCPSARPCVNISTENEVSANVNGDIFQILLAILNVEYASSTGI